MKLKFWRKQEKPRQSWPSAMKEWHNEEELWELLLRQCIRKVSKEELDYMKMMAQQMEPVAFPMGYNSWGQLGNQYFPPIWRIW